MIDKSFINSNNFSYWRKNSENENKERVGAISHFELVSNSFDWFVFKSKNYGYFLS
jgi:hypothetical protein